MRGKGDYDGLSPVGVGITPAYAGKSRALYAEAKNYEDHPRLCGEKHNARINRTGHVGSPPPMRGKAILTVFAWCCHEDHPRLCGEKL